MPWTVGDVDRHKKGLNPSQKKKWVSIANGVLRSCRAKGGTGCEGRAIRIANSKFSDENWNPEGIPDINSTWTNTDLALHDDFFKMQRNRPGGSNAGKYKKGPFCGPSGGAPKGTYPVNSKARAIAAIAYARHAPRPAGIRACVCRHWGSLPSCKKK